MNRIGVATAALLMMTALAAAQATRPASRPASTQPDADRIAALIAQLGAPKFPARQQAQKSLVRIGTPAEPALRDAAVHSASAEIRSRAKVAIDKIEDNLPDSPTCVSVRAVNEDPEKTLRSMADQAGITIAPQYRGVFAQGGQMFKPLTLDVDRAPLLVALEKFCKATHTQPIPNGGGDEEALSINQGDSGVWDQEDRAAIIATQIGHNRVIELSNNGVSRQDYVAVSFLFDPKRQPIGYQQPQLKVAEDENGVSLLPAPNDNGQIQDNMGDEENDGFQEYPFNSRWGFGAQLPLSFSARTGKTLVRLEGTMKIRVATKIETVNIPDLAKAIGTSVTAGNRKVDILAFSLNGNVASLRVRVTDTTPRTPSGQPMNGRQRPNLFNEFGQAALMDANGAHLLNEGGGGNGSDNQIEWQGQFRNRLPQPPKGPISLHWKVITQTQDVVVPFKFKNLPLPPD